MADVRVFPRPPLALAFAATCHWVLAHFSEPCLLLLVLKHRLSPLLSWTLAPSFSTLSQCPILNAELHLTREMTCSLFSSPPGSSGWPDPRTLRVFPSLAWHDAPGLSGACAPLTQARSVQMVSHGPPKHQALTGAHHALPSLGGWVQVSCHGHCSVFPVQSWIDFASSASLL